MVKLLLGAFLAFSFPAVHALEVTPTARVYQSLHFTDDLDFQNLDQAIDRQLKAYARIGLKGQIKFGTKVYPKQVLADSLILLKLLAHNVELCRQQNATDECLAIFNQEVNNSFAIYRPLPKKREEGYGLTTATKFTSYYSPDFTGSRTPSERFKHAIYRMPDRSADQNYTRVEIDFHHALSGKGAEIFWVEQSLFDLYLLHVQGGGRIKVQNPDGTEEVKYLSYNGKNTLPFNMIYKFMLQRGYLTTDTTIPAQRRFLEENPEKQEEIFNSCPSYVYFKESTEEPVGLDNIPLTENRSLALDRKVYRTTGLINFVKTVKASHLDENNRVVKVPFSRFFIGQDTGGAIKGNARCDLYMGYGPQAELTAYSMNDLGEQYFLVKK